MKKKKGNFPFSPYHNHLYIVKNVKNKGGREGFWTHPRRPIKDPIYLSSSGAGDCRRNTPLSKVYASPPSQVPPSFFFFIPFMFLGLIVIHELRSYYLEVVSII